MFYQTPPPPSRGFKHPNTRIYVRLLGPCFKTGRWKPFRQHHDTRNYCANAAWTTKHNKVTEFSVLYCFDELDLALLVWSTPRLPQREVGACVFFVFDKAKTTLNPSPWYKKKKKWAITSVSPPEEDALYLPTNFFPMCGTNWCWLTH